MTSTNQNDTELFNEVMPGCSDKTLYIKVTKPITVKGYKENFLPRVHEIIDKYGEFRLLIHFESFKGWEPEAAREDMETFVKLSGDFSKIALVNPPETEVFRRQIKKGAQKGEVRFFNQEDLEKAKEWVDT